MPPKFQNQQMEDAVSVGSVGPHRARLWMRAGSPGRHRVRWWPEDAKPTEGSELIVEIPEDPLSDHTFRCKIPKGDEQLRPLTRYRFRIASLQDDRLIGEGAFETAPAAPEDTPSSFSFAVMSCNQPFDAKGQIRPDAPEMLRATRAALAQHDCKFILMMGDQMYSDMPVDLSLFDSDYFASVAPPGRERIHDCTVDEVRRLFQERYRHFGSLPELREIVSNYPCYTIIDDHDIVDNWGSDPAHQNEEWRSIGEGARWAYFDYQAAHLDEPMGVLPRSFHYEITYGHTSFFVMDLRSERWVTSDEGELYSARQAEELEAFLKRNHRQRALFLVLSVPPVHLPRFLAAGAARLSQSGEDFSDRWSSLAQVDDRDRFLKRIREHQRNHPHQRLSFLAGDIHVGCAHELDWGSAANSVYQFVSSGLTNTEAKIFRIGARLLMRMNRQVDTLDGELSAAVRRVHGIKGRTKNPYAALNIGIVQMNTETPDRPATIEYFLYGHDGSEPVCVFQSPKL